MIQLELKQILFNQKIRYFTVNDQIRRFLQILELNLSKKRKRNTRWKP